MLQLLKECKRYKYYVFSLPIKWPTCYDMFPFSDHLTYMNICNLPAALGLDRQPWYHGEMERAAAESVLRHEGDFLVRMSPNTANNFVLSGIANSVAKHFLLLDENDQKVKFLFSKLLIFFFAFPYWTISWRMKENLGWLGILRNLWVNIYVYSLILIGNEYT